MKGMGKLVRDKIPQIIEDQGRRCVIRILEPQEYRQCLHRKLDEELGEFHRDQNLEELADLMEVVLACTEELGHTPQELEQLRLAKAEKRGAFRQRIYLEGVE